MKLLICHGDMYHLFRIALQWRRSRRESQAVKHSLFCAHRLFSSNSFAVSQIFILVLRVCDIITFDYCCCRAARLECSKCCQSSAKGRVEPIKFLLCWKAAFKVRKTCCVSRLTRLSYIFINFVLFSFPVMKVNLKYIFEVKLLDHSTNSAVQSLFSFTSDVTELWKIHCFPFVLFVVLPAHLSLLYDSVISFFFFTVFFFTTPRC